MTHDGIASRYLRDALADRRVVSTDEDILEELKAYRDRPVAFAQEILGLETDAKLPALWEAQRWLLNATVRERFVAWLSSRGAGKSFTLAVLASWWLYTRGRVLLVSPTLDQSALVLQRMISVVKGARVRLPGRAMRERLELSPLRYVACVASRDPDRLRGAHGGVVVPDDPDAPVTQEEVERLLEAHLAKGEDGDELLFVVDEACSVPEPSFRVMEGSLQKASARIVATGNPVLGLSDDHVLVRAATGADDRWTMAKVTSIDDAEAAELGLGPDPVAWDEVFVTPRWLVPREGLDAQLAGYEVDDAIVLSDVFGRFSTGATASLVIPRWALEGALEGELSEQARDLAPAVGVDVGGRSDQTVVVLVVGGEVRDLVSWRVEREDDAGVVSSAERLLANLRRWEDELDAEIQGGCIHIDESGMGGLGQVLAAKGLSVDQVQFGSGPAGDWSELLEGVTFRQRRSAMLWTVRRRLVERMLRVPRDPKFAGIWRQCAATHYERDAGPDGPIIQVEAKDAIRKRLGRSPDDLDALALACCEPAGEARGPVFIGRKHTPAEWDALRGQRVRWRPVWREGDGGGMFDAIGRHEW